MTGAAGNTRAVHVNALRWFVERDGGAEFVGSHGDVPDDDVVARALAATYPDTLGVLTTLGASGVRADCWFTVAEAGEAAAVTAVEKVRGAGPVPGASLGGLNLAVGGEDTGPIAARAVVTGLTCTGPDDEALARAAVALAEAFGPQVVWDACLADVMLVDAGMTHDQVRARWSSGGACSAEPRPVP